VAVIFSNQVGASTTSKAYSVQLDYGGMLREVTSWNPNVDPMVAGRMINNRYRQIVSRRKWYGLRVRGTATVPTVYSTGSATVTNGSTSVTGVGTAWTTSIVGLQFRNGFTNPYQTIVAVDAVHQVITLDTPFPGISGTWGYQIVLAYLTFGANVRHLRWAVNQMFGWPIKVNVPVEEINAKDTWRQNLGWAREFATRPPTPDGQYQVEVWPTPYALQSFPFEADTEPPEMVDDTDAPVAWIRSDLLVTGAIADALLHKPKTNPYYDATSAITIANLKNAEFKEELLALEDADEDLEQQAVSWDYDAAGGYGSTWNQMHDA
jgi:hypothetical protein